ncbi:MAG TPA: DUF4279 domain-containing protein [Candidatus Acidoferrales bacterium]|jgi:hypothetical protein|nr:DUF4279 domain-containing protein [Candidatus Acidoferrales bacterium]
MADQPENATEASGDEGYQTLRGFVTGEDPEEPIYVSQNLDLAPTHVHRRGELRHPSSRPYQHDMWIYEPPVKESEPLHAHIDALWAAIRDRKEYLLDLKRTATVDVFCGYRSNSDSAGVEVPYKSLQIFQELAVPFGLSIIIA